MIGQIIPAADSLKIVSILEDWNKGWQTKDFMVATKGYSDDARFTNAFGDKCMGRDQIQALLQKVFSLSFVMAGSSETVSKEFQILGSEEVVVYSFVIRKGQEMPDGSVLPDRQTSHMRVFQKIQGTWLIKGHLISDARDKQMPKH